MKIFSETHPRPARRSAPTNAPGGLTTAHRGDEALAPSFAAFQTVADWPTLSVMRSRDTAKLNDVEPYGYLKDVLERMTHGHPVSRLDDLLP